MDNMKAYAMKFLARHARALKNEGSYHCALRVSDFRLKLRDDELNAVDAMLYAAPYLIEPRADLSKTMKPLSVKPRIVKPRRSHRLRNKSMRALSTQTLTSVEKEMEKIERQLAVLTKQNQK